MKNNVEKFIDGLKYEQIIELSILLKNNNLTKLKTALEEKTRLDRDKFDKIKSGQITKFGLPDFADYDAYFPCEFIEVLDEERMIMKIYEPGIDKYHITSVSGLFVCD